MKAIMIIIRKENLYRMSFIISSIYIIENFRNWLKNLMLLVILSQWKNKYFLFKFQFCLSISWDCRSCNHFRIAACKLSLPLLPVQVVIWVDRMNCCALLWPTASKEQGKQLVDCLPGPVPIN
jgi:hypothetical protein